MPEMRRIIKFGDVELIVPTLADWLAGGKGHKCFDPSLFDYLVDVAEGKTQDNRFELAVTILKYVQQEKATRKTEDAVVALFAEVYRLWHSNEPLYYSVKMLARLETQMVDGVEKLVIVSEPAPEPEPYVTPLRVPAPQPQPQPETESAAIGPAPADEVEHLMTFDERFAPAEVQRRVDKVIAEAKAQRKTPVIAKT